jgi:SecD/SecF fusion protein
MDRRLQWKVLGIVILAIVALYTIWPPFTTRDAQGKVLQKGKINLGLDLQGGMHLVLRLDTEKIPPEGRKDAVDRAIEIIRNRIDQFGIGEMAIQKQGKDRIIVQLPGVTDRERALEIVGQTAHLEFKLVGDNTEDLKKALNNEPVEGYEVKYLETGRSGTEPLLVQKEAVLTGDLLVNAQTEFSSRGFGEPYVSLTFNAKGAAIFSTVTATNVGKRLAIVLDGKVQSAPVIREAIPSGRAQITGNFSVDEANALSVVLRVGALPAPVLVEEERTVGPLLGADSIRSGLKAAGIGALLVFAFMIFYYGLSGVVANITLTLNILLTLAALALFKGTLTLPGIAGLTLTIGMSVDANVLIFERIREELHLGKTLRAALPAGFHRALSAILDSNLTTIVAAALLFQFGTGPIKGFAVTLTIGLLANLLTAVTIAKVIFDLLIDNFDITTLRMRQLFPQTHIDFIGKRKICYAASSLIIIGGLSIFAMRGEGNFGVDFSGGTMQHFMFTNPVKMDDVRNVLKGMGLGNASIQQYGNPREVIIRTQDVAVKKISDKFKEVFKDNKYDLLRVETVGPAVGSHLKKSATLAILYGMGGILIYVMFRFNLKYAAAGVLALFHDVFVAVGALALTHRQFDLTIIAALLTIAGYSINDTVVIYDRIRENLKLVRKGTFLEIVNLSVNQTFGRTILTSLTTMLVTVSLLLFGGEVLSDFAFCLFIGFISGVYSTVYIASPLLITWQKKVAVKGGKK